jgi:formate dehydrogenase iron-sulfur subunit
MQNRLAPEDVYVRFRSLERGSYPKVTQTLSRFTCQHCRDAACVMACPTGAVYKGKTGLTHYKSDKCSGCGYCAKECPFGIPVIKHDQALRCTGCEALTENGKPSACVQTCIAGALSYGPREKMLAKAEQRVAALRGRYPDARVYSPQGVGKTGLLWVLREKPVVYGLPDNPRVAASLGIWKGLVQSACSGPLAAAGLIVGGVSLVISRRNHLRELHDSAGEGE